AFVEYQLYAESFRPDGFVAVAAYGEGGPGYICTDGALSEGGYEPTESRVGPPAELRLKSRIPRVFQPYSEKLVAPPYTDNLHLLAWRDAKGVEHAVKTGADWSRRQAHIRSSMQLVMGALPQPSRKAPLDLKILEEEQ